MNYKLFAYAALPIVSLAFLGVGAASARGFGGWGGGFGMGMMGFNLTPDEIASRQTVRFEQEAKIFGVSADDLKAGWAEGKSPMEVAEEKGITQEQIQARMKEARTAQMKTQLDALVTKGVITQVQAGKRLQVMQEREQNRPTGKMGRGMHRGFGW